MVEWTPYRCVIPQGGSTFANNSDCSILTEVYHVAHVPMACRILEDGMARAGLIGDESRLQKTRTSVTWVSANYWTPGSIYGTVQFSFPWQNLIEGNNVYWVEAMADYSPDAYRFLITPRDLSGSRHVIPYDPEQNKGPLRQKGDTWYWNGKYTSEFMLDRDLKLRECTKVSFIQHRPNLCRLFGRSCKERQRSTEWAARSVIAYVLGKGIKTANHAFRYQGSTGSSRQLSNGAELGLNGIWRALAPKKRAPAGPIKKQNSGEAVLRGALLLYGSSRVSEAKALTALMHSQDVFEDALTEIVRKHFGFKAFTLPD